MLIIRKKQFDIFEKNAEDKLKIRFVENLRREIPGETNAMDDGGLLSQVDKSFDSAKALNFEELEDIYRFCKLDIQSEKLMLSKTENIALYRVLCDTGVKPAKRLKFIEQNIIFPALERNKMT